MNLFKSSALAFFSLLSLSIDARAQAPTYDLAYLGKLPGSTSTVPHGVNDHGLVVGAAFMPGNVWTPIVMSATQTPAALPILIGDVSGIAYAVNNAGVIVGASYSPNFSSTAVMWTPSPSGYVLSALPPTSQGDLPSIPHSLNEHGDIVGELPNGLSFAWSASTGTIDLSTLGFVGIARCINESRQVVGGHHRIDLDTQIVDTAALTATWWELTFVNDAGVVAFRATNVDPILGWVHERGTYEFGRGAVVYASGDGTSVVGIDYAGTIPYSTVVGTQTEFLIHHEGFGSAPLASVLAPSAQNWALLYDLGSEISANGNICLWGFDFTAGLAGPVLLTPRSFHAILEGVSGGVGLPVLTGEGTLAGASPVAFKLSRAEPNAPLGLIAGLSRADLPFYGGLLVPTPTLVLPGFSTDANGELTLALTWPVGLPSGLTMYLQAWIADPSAPFGLAGSNALECEMP